MIFRALPFDPERAASFFVVKLHKILYCPIIYPWKQIGPYEVS